MSLLTGTRTSLEVSPAAPGIARVLATRVLGCWGLEALAEDCALLVSEVVTNAVMAGPLSIWFDMGVDDCGFVEVRVHDTSTAVPAKRHPDASSEDGRGLVIVEALASEWGVSPAERGKVVWFRLVVKDEEPAVVTASPRAAVAEVAALKKTLMQMQFPRRYTGATQTAPAG